MARLRQAIDVARRSGDPGNVIEAYSNLADMLGVVGRTEEALATAREGMALSPRRLRRTHEWMRLTVSETAYNAGDWPLSREYLIHAGSRLHGVAQIFGHARTAELALAEGDEAGGPGGAGCRRAAGAGVGRAAVDRHVLLAAGRAVPPPARPGGRAAGGPGRRWTAWRCAPTT